MIATGPSLRRAGHRRASCRHASQGDAPHRPAPLFAIAMADVDTLWRTPAGTALVDAALASQRPEDAEVVEIGGTAALVLRGTAPFIVALAEGFASAPFAPPAAHTARVFANDGLGWRRLRPEALVHG